jgi:hypothetical protein
MPARAVTQPRASPARASTAQRGRGREPSKADRLINLLFPTYAGRPEMAEKCWCCDYVGSIPPGVPAHSNLRQCSPAQVDAALRKLSS